MNVKKIMRAELGGMRLSKKAVTALELDIKEYIKKQTRRAMVLANHAARKTLQEDDMALALQ